MNGKISKESELHIERNGVMKPQFCPYNPYGLRSDNGMTACGDWCPLFGDPRPEHGTASAILDLCNHKQLFFDEFVDERKDLDG
jgi:hypothetical protein